RTRAVWSEATCQKWVPWALAVTCQHWRGRSSVSTTSPSGLLSKPSTMAFSQADVSCGLLSSGFQWIVITPDDRDAEDGPRLARGRRQAVSGLPALSTMRTAAARPLGPGSRRLFPKGPVKSRPEPLWLLHSVGRAISSDQAQLFLSADR